MSIHREKKQRPEFEGSVMLHADYSQYLFPEPWGRILSISFKPRLETHCSPATSSTPAFLLHGPLDISTPDSLYSLYNSLTAWSENREWENGNSWTSGLSKCNPWTSSNSIPWKLVRNANPWSHPDLLNQKLREGPTIWTNYVNKYPGDPEAWEQLIQTFV